MPQAHFEVSPVFFFSVGRQSFFSGVSFQHPEETAHASLPPNMSVNFLPFKGNALPILLLSRYEVLVFPFRDRRLQTRLLRPEEPSFFPPFQRC